MKKIILVSLCAVCALTASAQRASISTSFFSAAKSSGPVILGVRVGGNLSSFGGDLGKAYDKSKLGYHAGLSIDIPIVERFGINTGLFYSLKGAKFDKKSKKATVSAGYIEIPFLASYRYHFSERTRLEIDLGPYFAYGIHGKVSFKDEYYHYYYDDDDIFDDDGGDMKLFDAGVAFGIGVTANKFYAGLHYEAGLVNVLSRGIVGLSSGKFNNFLFTVGYNF